MTDSERKAQWKDPDVKKLLLSLKRCISNYLHMGDRQRQRKLKKEWPTDLSVGHEGEGSTPAKRVTA